MKVLSLFDGISCGMVALERAGIPVERYVAYEIEPNAIKISKKNYPQIEHCGDVTTADFTQYEGFDLLIGGSPCQSLSIVQSKTRQHLDGKSKLFFEFVRAKEEMKPKWFLFENVASMNEESKQAISELLGCQPVFIDSGDFSAQERPRYYWTNIPVSLNYKKSTAVLGNVLEAEVDSKYYYEHPLMNVNMQKQVCATMDYKNHEMHKRIFNPSFKVHTLTTCGGGNTQKKVLQNGKARKLTPLEYERLQTLPDGYTEGVATSHRYNSIGNGWTVDVIAHILSYIAKEESEEKEMELRVQKPTFPEVIQFNFEELKQEITLKSSEYVNLVYADEQISEAKKDRAKLNKFVKALSDERIKIKKECLKPYEDFEAKIKELDGIVNAAIKNIDNQVKGYEEKKKAEKLDDIQNFWNSCTPPFPIKFEQIFDQKWLNATVSMKSVQTQIDELLAKVESDLATLENLPEFSFEAKEVYKTTLNLQQAIQEGARQAEIQKKKQEEERLKSEAELAKHINPPVEEPKVEVINGTTYITNGIEQIEPQRMWIGFKANLTVEQAHQLKNFFDCRGIEFEQIAI